MESDDDSTTEDGTATFGATDTGVAVFDVSESMRQGRTATAVVSALAEVLEDDPTSMQPLYSAVDTDALDTLFAPRCPGDCSRCGAGDCAEVSVMVSYGEYSVVLSDGGRLEIHD